MFCLIKSRIVTRIVVLFLSCISFHCYSQTSVLAYSENQEREVSTPSTRVRLADANLSSIEQENLQLTNIHIPPVSRNATTGYVTPKKMSQVVHKSKTSKPEITAFIISILLGCLLIASLFLKSSDEKTYLTMRKKED